LYKYCVHNSLKSLSLWSDTTFSPCGRYSVQLRGSRPCATGLMHSPAPPVVTFVVCNKRLVLSYIFQQFSVPPPTAQPKLRLTNPSYPDPWAHNNGLSGSNM
jgi:hypothetical protein